MSQLIATIPVSSQLEAIARLVQALPIKKFKLDPSKKLGTYVEGFVDMVNASETRKLLQTAIVDREAIGVSQLLTLLWQQVAADFDRLPTKTFRIDPLHPFHQSATLFIEEVYVELNDVISLIHRLEPQLQVIETLILQALSQCIALKLQQISAPEKALASPRDILPELLGKKAEVNQATPIRERAIATLLDSETLAEFSPLLTPQVRAVVDCKTAASWWIANEPRIFRAILLQINHALDEAVFSQSAISDSAD